MTITLQAVNELIASLESAGELSIKETKVMALAKSFKQLASENVALKSAITDHSHSVHFCEVCGKDDPCSTDDVCYALKDTPATDRIVAGIKADGVGMFVEKCREKSVQAISSDIRNNWWLAGEHADDFAKQLREGADK
nr:MAG TPA: recombination protein [Bacteriophage sp.]